jgi:TDG/mug DNA glycosylase family protein
LAFLGKAAIAGLLGRRDIAWGEQSMILAGARVWVLPNPSGLNRSFRLDDLVRTYSEFRERIAQDSAGGANLKHFDASR